MEKKYKKLIIKGGHVCDPFQSIKQSSDIVIIDGKISEFHNNIGSTGLSRDFQRDDHRIIDASGMIVMPGLIDLHTHLRDPGYEWKEDIYSGSLAAAKGGFTTICAMPNTNPVPDSAPVVRDFFRSIFVVKIFSGFCFATDSISTPPSVLLMKAIFELSLST